MTDTATRAAGLRDQAQVAYSLYEALDAAANIIDLSASREMQHSVVYTVVFSLNKIIKDARFSNDELMRLSKELRALAHDPKFE